MPSSLMLKTQAKTKIRFGHSPDPDDAFMFYAIRHQKIDLKGFEVGHVIEDIESLNRRALSVELEVTAVSAHAYAFLNGRYAVLASGASMGDGYGPIVVAKKRIRPSELKGKTIAVPGTMTSAYLALKLFERDVREQVVPFDQIPAAVESGAVDAGVLIHEGQITYRDQGLRKVLDLGEWWRKETKLPLPLGVDVIRKSLGARKMKAFAEVFRSSIEYSLSHRKEALDYALPFGRGLARKHADRFVGMYVNEYARDLGSRGKEAIRVFLSHGYEAGLLPKKVVPEFVEIKKGGFFR